MRTIPILLMALLLLPSALAYQQGHLVFSMDGWDVFEQRSASQSFKKQDLYLEVNSYSDKADLLASEEFAQAFNGIIHTNTTANGIWQEFVVTTSERAFMHAQASQEGEQYAVTIISPKSKLFIAKQEMQKFTSGVSFSAEKNVVLAPWEEPLPFFTAHPLPWAPILLVAALCGLVFWKVKRRKSAKQAPKPEPKPEKPEHKDTTPP